MPQPASPALLHPYQLHEVRFDNIEARRLPNQPSDQLAQTPLGLNVTASEPVGNVCEVRASVTIGDPESHTLIYFIHVDVVGSIQGPADAPPHLLHEFGRSQAVGLLWPYAREVIHSLSLRLGLSPVLLPTLQVLAEQAAPEDKRNEGESAEGGGGGQ